MLIKNYLSTEAILHVSSSVFTHQLYPVISLCLRLRETYIGLPFVYSRPYPCSSHISYNLTGRNYKLFPKCRIVVFLSNFSIFLFESFLISYIIIHAKCPSIRRRRYLKAKRYMSIIGAVCNLCFLPMLCTVLDR